MSQSAIIHEGMNHNLAFQSQCLEEDANFCLMCGDCEVISPMWSSCRGGMDGSLFHCQDENIKDKI